VLDNDNKQKNYYRQALARRHEKYSIIQLTADDRSVVTYELCTKGDSLG